MWVMKHLPQRVGRPNQHIAAGANQGHSRHSRHRRQRLVGLVVAAIVIAACGGNLSTESAESTESADRLTTGATITAQAAEAASPAPSTQVSTSTTPNTAPCTSWEVGEDEDFTGGDPTMLSPVSGNPSTPVFRRCGSKREIFYMEPPLCYDASQASVIQPLTTSSTSSGPCTLMT